MSIFKRDVKKGQMYSIQKEIDILNPKITNHNFYDIMDTLFKKCTSKDELLYVLQVMTEKNKEIRSTIPYQDIKGLFIRRMSDIMAQIGNHYESRVLHRSLIELYFRPVANREVERLLSENDILIEDGSPEAIDRFYFNVHRINAIRGALKDGGHNITYYYDHDKKEAVFKIHTTEPHLNGYGSGPRNSELLLNGQIGTEYISPYVVRFPTDVNYTEDIDVKYFEKELKNQLSPELRNKMLNSELQYALYRGENELSSITNGTLSKEFDRIYDDHSFY
jgi:hypothetical protein